ncbi:hypothetical protein [Actinoplanes sp. NPDC051494]|uniref:hypothetical protein n=1 Tax=Actinoplanes sp. NPDC051494 TaxID=3363907 RepID=UPI0037AEDF5E
MRRTTALVAATVFVALVAGCSADAAPRDGSPTPTDAAEVERVAGVHLPASAELLRAETVGFQDSQVWAVFRMPAKELDGFLERGKLPDPEPGLHAVAGSFDTVPGLDPDAAVTVSGINQWDAVSPEGYYRKMMFDLDDPGEVTTYLVAVMP